MALWDGVILGVIRGHRAIGGHQGSLEVMEFIFNGELNIRVFSDVNKDGVKRKWPRSSRAMQG